MVYVADYYVHHRTHCNMHTCIIILHKCHAVEKYIIVFIVTILIVPIIVRWSSTRPVYLD